MKYLLTGKQMKEADEFTICNIGIPSMVLMERAALKVVEVIAQEVSDCNNVLVVCGSGNNGGDGYAIARLLHLKGIPVEIFFAGNEDSRSEENQRQAKIAAYYHIPVRSKFEDREYSVIVDALFGTGLKKNVEGSYREVIECLNQMSGLKVAVDIPSGINDTDGCVMGTAFRADITVAIAFLKRGLVSDSGNEFAGKVIPVDIGITGHALQREPYMTYCYETADLYQAFPKRKRNSHKGSYGKVLMIVGSKGMSGAAYLSAKAAYAVGAGLVQIYTPEANRMILQQLLPEAVITTYEQYDAKEVEALLSWADVVGIGCGLGKEEIAVSLVRDVLEKAEVPCVVDADGLNILAEHLDWLNHSRAEVILTPHMKEMTRLLHCDMEKLRTHRMEMLIDFIETYNTVCVLKDARTLVAEKKKEIYFNLSGNAAMAKGGSGDVLTGTITGILAQKAEPYTSACLGVYLHGLAGDAAREQKGSYSVLASDLIDGIAQVLKEI